MTSVPNIGKCLSAIHCVSVDYMSPKISCFIHPHCLSFFLTYMYVPWKDLVSKGMHDCALSDGEIRLLRLHHSHVEHMTCVCLIYFLMCETPAVCLRWRNLHHRIQILFFFVRFVNFIWNAVTRAETDLVCPFYKILSTFLFIHELKRLIVAQLHMWRAVMHGEPQLH